MPSKYLQHFPKPLLDDLASGRWLPVIGAGLSVNAELIPPKKMPLWTDLGTILANELPDFSASGVLDTISAYQHEFGRAKLIERLTDILLIKEAQPGAAHKAFCSIPFDIVCTTNFDFLLERQYEATPRYVYPVIDEDQLSINGSTAGTLLLKLHGDLRHPGRLVVTEDDYDSFLAKYPLIATYLSNQLITKTAVFVGYSLDDPDFRQIWSIVTERLGRTRRMAYSLSVSSRTSDIARFERRGVKVINLPGSRDRYGEILAETFRELHEFVRDNVISVSKVKEEEPLQELMLPRGAATRLCFFAIPFEVLPLYRSQIFPLVEEIGFVPITADDVVSPGDNINAKIDALIDRASVMVVELTSQWTRAEYEIAISRTKDVSGGQSQSRNLRIIVVMTARDQIPPSALEYHIIVRSADFVSDVDSFAGPLRGLLEAIADEINLNQPLEAVRLLEHREYRAAVISAMTYLESSLRSRLEKNLPVSSISPTVFWRPQSLVKLLDLAVQSNLIDREDTQKIRGWIKIRNEAVHTNGTINRYPSPGKTCS